jgi:hypothetical protein
MGKPLRIAHITATFPSNYTGTGMVCYHNALGLARRGHQVTVFTADYPPEDGGSFRAQCPASAGGLPATPRCPGCCCCAISI